MNEINGLHITVLIISGLIILPVLLYLMRSGSADKSVKKHRPSSEIQAERTKPCPLCGEPLKRGETVHSVLYPGKPDSLMEIFGCPHCEKPGSDNRRICPVCRKVMTDDNRLIARVFEKPGKKHVHVLGCSTCYRGLSSINRTP